jgi:hypothetical protein
MKRLAFWAVKAFVLWVAVEGVSAQERDQIRRGGRREGVPPAVRMERQDPNRRMDPNQRFEPNQLPPMLSSESGGEPNQQQIMEARQRAERMRRQTRQRILEQSNQRRRQTGEGPFRRTDANAFTAMGDKGKVRDETAQQIPEKGIQRQQQVVSVEQQLAHEEEKHRERVARLNRIRELAEQQGNTEAIARVDTLLEQEKRHYEAKTQRMQHRKDTMAQIEEKAASRKVKRPRVADANKDAPETPAEN